MRGTSHTYGARPHLTVFAGLLGSGPEGANDLWQLERFKVVDLIMRNIRISTFTNFNEKTLELFLKKWI